jgi:hypothetical protein
MRSTDKSDIAVLQNQVIDIKCDVSEIKEHYLTREEFNDKFDPVRKLVYGLVSVILLSVVGVSSSAIIFFLRMQK